MNKNNMKKKEQNSGNNRSGQRSNKKKTQSRVATQPRHPGGIVSLSECGEKYMIAIAEPWNPKAYGACIPSFPSRKSQKMHMVSRVSGTIGTGGIGFLYVAPCLSTNAPCLYTSTATTDIGFNSTSYLSQANLIAGKIAVSGALGPYVTSNFNGDTDTAPLVQGRIISAGARVTYTGTVLNMAGVMSCYTSPDHGNLSDLSYNTIQTYPEVSISRVTSKPCELVMSPVALSETEYKYNPSSTTTADNIWPYNGGTDGTKSYNDGNIDIGPMIGVVFITGISGQQFFVDYIQHVEFIGPATQVSATVNHVDRPAMEAVLNAAATATVGPGTKSWSTQIYEGTRNAMSTASSVYGAIPPRVKAQIANSAMDWVMSNRGGSSRAIEFRR